MKEKIPSSNRGQRYKKINFIANFIFILVAFASVGYVQYDDFRKEELYNAMYMSFIDTKEIEYGAHDYNTLKLIDNYENGEISNYTKDVDTSTVGLKELKYELAKEGVSKEYVIKVEVKDTKAPKISLNKDTVSVYVGSSYDLKSNIKSVTDEIDGAIKYFEKTPSVNENGYYTISSDYNKNKKGSYKVKVSAVDKNGNSTESSYTIKVIARPSRAAYVPVSGNYKGPSSVDTSSVVNAAKSLVGSRYVYAGSSPSVGFDCSGLVSYVYRAVSGKDLPRTVGGLAYIGNAVSESNMQPGDIIIWSHRSDYVPTHAALYIGNGQMIHAANTRLGVVQMSVTYWKGNGRNKIVSIRRV